MCASETDARCRRSIACCQVDPNNRQAIDMKALVETVLQREGAIGLAVFSSAAVAVASIGLALLRKR